MELYKLCLCVDMWCTYVIQRVRVDETLVGDELTAIEPTHRGRRLRVKHIAQQIYFHSLTHGVLHSVQDDIGWPHCKFNGM